MGRLLAGVATLLLAALLSGAAIGDPGLARSGFESRGEEKRYRSAGAERGIRACANSNRRARGLEPLRPSRPLARAARLHARNMARLGFFDHTDPQGRGVGERVAIFARAGRFAYIGENIAAGYGSPAAACRSWMRSVGHKRNILDRDFTQIGGGFARGGRYDRYYVQVFGTPRR